MDMLSVAGQSQILTKAALAKDAGSVTTYSTTGTMVYAIRGKEYSKAAVTNGTTPTTDVNTGVAFVPLAANQGTVFLWMINAAGTVAVAQGLVSPGYPYGWPLDSAGNFQAGQYGGAPNFPPIADGYVPFAYQIIKNGSTGSSWTFGSSNWNATGITSAIQDITTLPDRPQIS